MIGEFKPYPAYKDSGMPSLGEVPEHWAVLPLGRIGHLFKGNGGNKEDEVAAGVPCVRYGDLYTRHEFFIRNTKAYVTEEKAAAYTPIRYGDVLFAASGETAEDIGKSAVNLIEGDVRCGGDVLVMRPKVNVLPEFLGYATDSAASRNQKTCMGRGFTVVHIYSGQLKRLVLPLPPFEEQTQIVTFLNYADRRIRRFIRSKQELIKLLEEQKQVVINQAVTSGLDPNVPLKPSGIEWQGNIPKHWKISRLKFLFKEVDSRTASGTEVLLSLRMHRGLVPHEEVSKKLISSDALIGYKKVKPRQLVMNRMRAAIGMFAVVDQPGLVSPDYAIFEHQRFVDPNYFLHLFKTSNLCSVFRLESKGLGTGSSGFMRLYTDRFGIIQVPLPPYEEQITIAREVETVIRDFHLAKNRVEREISLLHEFRTRLISDVVTGKLDVREAAAHLPAELDEPEPLEDDLPAELDLDADSDLEATAEDEAA